VIANVAAGGQLPMVCEAKVQQSEVAGFAVKWALVLLCASIVQRHATIG
jgi:hypothetical protein